MVHLKSLLSRKQKRTLLVVTNDKAGVKNTETETDQALQMLDAFSDMHTCTVTEIADKETAAKLIEEHQPYAIVAVGGDGTVNASATAAYAHDIKLGVIPAGTFNHFAKHMNIPLDQKEAAAVIISEHTETIDLGVVNETYFINFISLGVYADIVKNREQLRQSGYSKWSAFRAAFWNIFFRATPLKLELAGEQDSYQKKTALVFIGNGSFDFGSLDILANRTDVDSGKLQLILMKDYSRLRLLCILLLSLCMNIKHRLGFESVMLSTITIKTKQKTVTVSLDGEIMELTTPLTISKKPAALNVFTPTS